MGGKFALLIGNKKYSYLGDLDKSVADVKAVEQALKNPYIGAFDDVQTLLDASTETIKQAINTFFAGKEPDDTVLLYLTGHGVESDRSRWFFACRETPKEEEDEKLEATSISSDFIRTCMDHNRYHCRAERQIIIIDTCKAAAFMAKGTAARPQHIGELLEEPSGAGRIILAAAGASEDARQGAAYFPTSVFTYYIVQGLITGAAARHNSGWITVEDIFDHVSKYLHEENIHGQKPRRGNDRDQWGRLDQWGTLMLAKDPLYNQMDQDPHAQYNMGYILSHLGGREEAREFFERALAGYNEELKYSPYNAILWKNKGDTHFHLGQCEDALKAYRVAVRLTPSNPTILHNQASMLCHLEQYLEAVTMYEAARKLAPHEAKVRYNLGLVYKTLNRNMEAFRELDTAYKLAPYDSGILYHLSSVLSAMKNEEKDKYSQRKYEHLYQEAMEVQLPGDIGISYSQWGILEDLEWNIETTRILITARKLAPATAHAWIGEAARLLQQRRTDAARRAYVEANKAAKEDTRHNAYDGHAWLCQGYALMKLGLIDQALLSYDRALEYPPDEALANHLNFFGTNGFIARVLAYKGEALLLQRKYEDVYAPIAKALELALPLCSSLIIDGRELVPINALCWIDKKQYNPKKTLETLEVGDHVNIFSKGSAPHDLVATIYNIAGDAKYDQRELNDAARLYTEAATYSTSNDSYRYALERLEYICMQLGMFEEAQNIRDELNMMGYG